MPAEKSEIPREETTLRAQPFLSWAGGKRKLIPLLVSHLPSDMCRRRYVEPFLGAGSLFFKVGPTNALLSDANPFLIAAYEGIRDHADAVRGELKKHIESHSSAHYYRTRDAYNRLRHSAAQTARFIYLNKTCFNGIFRVNTKGQFNVPKGSKDRPTMPLREDFQAIAKALSHATLTHGDFSKTLANVAASDFVYLDPPYPALNGTAYFTHYTSDRFDSKAQERLAENVKQVDNRGASFLMSNADVDSIRALYANFDMVSVPVQRFVSCKGKRVPVSELLIKNY